MENLHSYLFSKLIESYNDFSSIEIDGKVRNRPEIQIKPIYMNLKTSSKLYFMTRENIERIILHNLSFVPEKFDLSMNTESLFDMLVLADIN